LRYEWRYPETSWDTAGFRLPVLREPALLTSAGMMSERRQHRVSGGQEARSERPATGYGEPEAGLGALRESMTGWSLPYGKRDACPTGYRGRISRSTLSLSVPRSGHDAIRRATTFLA